MFSGSGGSSTGTTLLQMSCLLRKMRVDTLCGSTSCLHSTPTSYGGPSPFCPLCPIAKGKCCMFVFVLEVLDEDGPGPSGPGSFFTLPKKRTQSVPKGKAALAAPAPSAPPPPPPLFPPPSPLPLPPPPPSL